MAILGGHSINGIVLLYFVSKKDIIILINKNNIHSGGF